MYWMGIDIGSISTDLVLLNDKNEIEKELYLKTGSTPVKACLLYTSDAADD